MSLGSLGNLVVSLTAETAQFTYSMDKAAYQQKQSMDRMIAQAKQAGPAIAAGLLAGAGALVAIVKSSVDAQDALNDMAERTGLAVETLAGLQYAAKLSDTSLESLAASVGRLQKAIGEADAGNDEMKKTLAALGITAKDPEKALIQLAAATARLHDPNKRAVDLTALLGKSYMDLIPLLNQGSAGLREMIARGRELNPATAESAAQSAQLNDVLDTMKTQAGGLATIVTNSVLPSFVTWITHVRTLVQEHGILVGLLGGIGAAVIPGADTYELTRRAKLESEANKLFQDRARLMRYVADLQTKLDAGGENPLWETWLDGAKRNLDEVSTRLKAVLAARQALVAERPDAAAGSAPITLPVTPVTGARVKLGKQYTDAQWALEEYAHALRTAHELALQADADWEAMFENATQVADEWQSQLAAANESQRSAAQGYKDMIDPIEQYRRQLEEISALVEAGFLSADQAIEAEFRVQQQIDQINGVKEAAKQTMDVMEEFARSAAQNMQSALANYLFDPFKQGLDGMLLGFINTLRRMAAEALSSQIMKYVLSGMSTSGLGWLSSLAGALSGGAHDAGGYIPAGTVGLVGERGPELIHGPASVTSRAQTADLLHGRGNAQPQSIRIVNVFDPNQLPGYVTSSGFERVVLNILQRNSKAVRTVLA